MSVALPRIAAALDVMERELADDRDFLVGDLPTLADFFMLPTMTTLRLTGEGNGMLADKPRIAAWKARMEELPTVGAVRSMVTPQIGKPVEHARAWVASHRPRY